MGAAASVKCNRFCTDTNQSIDHPRSHAGRQTSTRKGTLYSSDDDSPYGHGEASFSDSEPEPNEQYEGALKAQIFESFRVAVQKANTSLIQYYFSEHPDLRFSLNRWRNGDGCMHTAVRMQDLKLLEMLLEEGPHHGIMPNDQNPFTGDTPLHIAVREAQPNDKTVDIVKMFMKHPDVDVNIMNKEFHTALRIAVENRKYDIMDLLSKHALDLEMYDYGAANDEMSLHETIHNLGGRHNETEHFADHSDSLDPDEVPLLCGDIDVPEEMAVEDAGDILQINEKSKRDLLAAADHHQTTTGITTKQMTPSLDSRSIRGMALDAVSDTGTPSDDTPRDLNHHLMTRAMSPSAYLDDNEFSKLSEAEKAEYNKLTIEQKMDEDAKETLKRLKLKNKNPFSKIKVSKQDSASLNHVLDQMVHQLPELEGHLEKRTSKAPHTWHKRWVMVRDEWLLWNDRVINHGNHGTNGHKKVTLEMRKRFKGAVNLHNIVEISRTGNSGRKFMLKVQYKTHEKLHERNVLWRCLDRQEREYWVNGLKQRLHYQSDVKRLYSD